MFCVCPNKKKGLCCIKITCKLLPHAIDMKKEKKKKSPSRLEFAKQFSILVFLIRKYWKNTAT